MALAGSAAAAATVRPLDVEAGGIRNYLLSRLRVGIYPGLSSTYAPSVIRELKAANPSLVVELVEADAETLARMVAEGSVDLAVSPLLPEPAEWDRRHRAIWREDVLAVLCDDDPLAERDSLTVADLLDRELIGTRFGAADDDASGGFELRAVLGTAAARAKIVPLADQPRALAALVRYGFGIGVIGRLALAFVDTAGLVVRPIDAPTAYRDMAVFWAARRAEHIGIAAFLDAQMRAPLPKQVSGVALVD